MKNTGICIGKNIVVFPEFAAILALLAEKYKIPFIAAKL